MVKAASTVWVSCSQVPLCEEVSAPSSESSRDQQQLYLFEIPTTSTGILDHDVPDRLLVGRHRMKRKRPVLNRLHTALTADRSSGEKLGQL
jgi:hypothetical protein